MPAIHVRDVPEPVLAALRERAANQGRSMQEEVRQILQAAATASPPRTALEPLHLTTVRTGSRSTSTWSREEIYGDDGR